MRMHVCVRQHISIDNMQQRAVTQGAEWRGSRRGRPWEFHSLLLHGHGLQRLHLALAPEAAGAERDPEGHIVDGCHARCGNIQYLKQALRALTIQGRLAARLVTCNLSIGLPPLLLLQLTPPLAGKALHTIFGILVCQGLHSGLLAGSTFCLTVSTMLSCAYVGMPSVHQWCFRTFLAWACGAADFWAADCLCRGVAFVRSSKALREPWLRPLPACLASPALPMFVMFPSAFL